MITRHYCDGPDGQLHFRLAAPAEESRGVMMALHPAPYSGLYFTTVMPQLVAGGWTVVAPDYPGYGGSDALDAQPSIADYATAMLSILEQLSTGAPVLLGFHTGCLVATEMALNGGASQLVLVDVPYFPAEDRPGLLKTAARPMELSGDIDSIAGAWDFNVTKRLDSMPVERGTELFAEQVRVAPRSHRAFQAAFSYDADAAFAALNLPVDIIATQSGLLEPSRVAATLIPNSRLTEQLDITRAVFEEGADAIAGSILSVAGAY